MVDLSEDNAVKAESTVKESAVTLSVREVISQLAHMEDMDAEVCVAFHNFGPVPVTDVEDNGDGQVVFTSA